MDDKDAIIAQLMERIKMLEQQIQQLRQENDRLFDVPMQYCLAHLIREVRFLAEHSVKKLARWGKELLGGLKKLFETLHRRQDLTPNGFLRSMKKSRKAFWGGCAARR